MFSASEAAPRRSGLTLSLFAVGAFKRNLGIILLSLIALSSLEGCSLGWLDIANDDLAIRWNLRARRACESSCSAVQHHSAPTLLHQTTPSSPEEGLQIQRGEFLPWSPKIRWSVDLSKPVLP